MKYTPDWLALREHADARARDRDLIAQLGSALAARRDPLIVDLGCGTGALRGVLASVAPESARWRMIDNDPDVLAVARQRFPEDEILSLDLAADVEAALAGADCVAATAFYDLVSESWLDRFVAALPKGAIVYAALTYDGREIWRPAHADDAAVLAAFHRHQRRDIGFGPALGPDAGAAMAEKLRAAGWRVETRDAWWRLERPRDAALMDELADGIAVGLDPYGVNAHPWRAQDRQTAEIGHLDLLALPS